MSKTPVIDDEPQNKTPSEPQTPQEPVEEPETPVVNDEPQNNTPSEPQTPQEPVEEPETPVNTPSAPTQDGSSGGNGAIIDPVIANGTVDALSGRVTTIDPNNDDIVSLRILSDVEHGNVTVNPDNTFALVMTQSEFTGRQSFTYEATMSDGSTQTHQMSLNVSEGPQSGGWGTGESHYMLETDADDRVIVEAGENHTKVYISGGNNALSLSEVATMEGVSTSQVTGSFLESRGYGQSENLALDQEAGMRLWNHVTPRGSSTSNWLLLENGHEYDNLGRILQRDTHGESELNPLYLGTWGSGEAADITSEFFQFQESSSNVVVQDLTFSGGAQISFAENMIFDNVDFGDKASFQRSEGITIRNSEFTDIYRDASIDGGAWEAHGDRLSGFYSNYTDGLLMEGNFFDHNGWAEGYDESGAASGGQPPSMYSQNIYIDARMTDVTMRDTITMRGASFGALLRSGGFVEDNVFLDNNAAFATLGGDYNGTGPVGQYTLMADNLVTSGAHKLATQIGAKSLGIADDAQFTSLVDNIVAHLANPDDPSELAERDVTHDAIRTLNPFYDDTIVWNWQGSGTVWDDHITTEQNADGLDPAALDATTIQNFTAQLLGRENATIDDLANYLRGQLDGTYDDVVDADLIIRFFQEGFGIAPDIRDSATTLRFVPDELGDGVRWDNRMNWDTDDTPGLYAGDSVDLGGNEVVFGGNTTIDTADLGPGGALSVYGGRLDLTGGFTGDDSGSLTIRDAGQVWAEGSDAADLDIMVEGGRFVNTGTFENADLTATGGQTILASDGAEFDLGASRTLSVFDAAARVGFDGENGGMAILDMHEGATVAFSAQSGDLGSIEEFSSGRFGDSPDVQSGIDLGDATLQIDLAGLSASQGTAFTLMSADEIVGIFDDTNIGGLGGRNATIVVDYEADTVTLQLSSGNGSVSVQTVGSQSDVSSGAESLWNALTADQPVASDTAPAVDDLDDPLLAA